MFPFSKLLSRKQIEINAEIKKTYLFFVRTFAENLKNEFYSQDIVIGTLLNHAALHKMYINSLYIIQLL